MEPRDDDVLDPDEPERSPPLRADGTSPVLDLGDRTRDDPGEGPAGRVRRRPMPGWQRWAAVGVALLVGVLAGAYVSYARTESASLAADVRGIELIAGRVTGSFSVDQFGLRQPPRRLTVELHNAGSREVEVSDVRLREWRFRQDSDAARTRTVAPGTWMRFVLVGDISCIGSAPRELEVDVRTDAGDSSVVVPLPPAGPEEDASDFRRSLDTIYSTACGDPGSLGITSGTVNTRRSAVDPRVMEMGVQLLVPGGDTEITAVSAATAGFRGTGQQLPVAAGEGRPSVTVAIAWRIDSCPDTTELDEVTLDVELSDQPDAVPVVLRNDAVAALARFAVEECGL